MKNLVLLITSCFVIQSAFAQVKTDSVPKKQHEFLLGLTIAPNFSLRENGESKRNIDVPASSGGELTIKESPALGSSALLNAKITEKRFLFNIGVGFGAYNFKGHIHNGYLPGGGSLFYNKDWDYEYKHVIGGVNTSYNALLGKNKLWYAGLSFDFNYITLLTKNVKYIVSDYNTGDVLISTNTNYDFVKQMFVFWGGLEVGRTIKAVQWLQINISATCKYSSKIDAEYVGSLSNYVPTEPRNLITASLNISFYPILKLK